MDALVRGVRMRREFSGWMQLAPTIAPSANDIEQLLARAFDDWAKRVVDNGLAQKPQHKITIYPQAKPNTLNRVRAAVYSRIEAKTNAASNGYLDAAEWRVKLLAKAVLKWMQNDGGSGVGT
ncbi:MAG: hypothetical protein IPJ08_25075 [Burkholderiales bacterium]|nr:hypothetical protein [Burkholderiales bacterium]